MDPDDAGIDTDAMTYEQLAALGETIGVQSKGLAQEILDALPETTYAADAASEGDEEEETCAVCVEAFEDGERVRKLPHCGHCFHVDCLAPWLAENKCCPMCKTEITAP